MYNSFYKLRTETELKDYNKPMNSKKIRLRVAIVCNLATFIPFKMIKRKSMI
ncbi:hypothetical protein [Clostridium novyi]|uniref:hypothetical protein n=1 Tax=Clostridium novyi TaxID=1542 RepID=UPI000A591D2C|nr:hypothetical protein [Clostridium novyi]